MISEFIKQYDIYSWQILSIVFVAGFVAGFINTFAGSGTAINYFLFNTLGMPMSMANGTVRLGVIMQSIANSIQFYRRGQLDIVKGLFISIPVTIGMRTPEAVEITGGLHAGDSVVIKGIMQLRSDMPVSAMTEDSIENQKRLP